MKKSNKKLTIEKMRKIARAMGGRCLSTTYVNTKTKLKWQCKRGHTWDSKPAHIKSGHWCPSCYGNARLTLNNMKEIARAKGGECLSTNYVNTQTKLRWKCKREHIWEARPKHIKMGCWCPICSRNKNS